MDGRSNGVDIAAGKHRNQLVAHDGFTEQPQFSIKAHVVPIILDSKAANLVVMDGCGLLQRLVVEGARKLHFEIDVPRSVAGCVGIGDIDGGDPLASGQ